MPIQMPSVPSWSQTKTVSKQGFDKVYGVVDKLGAPINRFSNKIGSEAFWPTTLDKESDKAARILRSFCKDGFYVEEPEGTSSTGDQPKGKVRVVKKIPSQVIKKAKGLAIFTTMRTGLWVSGAGGSGILVGRTPSGDWSPPSGIMLHTAGLGFLVGIDIYDCVVVINTEKAMEAFTKIRCTLGGEVSAVAGPVGAGAILESEVHKRQAPVWTYLKSRGFYAGVQVDGTIIIERTDENERFYGERIKVADILAGKARHPPPEIKTLLATIRAAQGDNVEESALPSAEPTPGDMELVKPYEVNGFGLPSEDDPDPFGVQELQAHGMEIREAGTKARPSLEAFEYRPNPSSPIFTTYRRSLDSNHSRRNSKRDSVRSVASTDRGTQTESASSPITYMESPHSHSPLEKTTENLAEENKAEEGLGISHISQLEPPTIMDQMAPQPVISRARLVTIPKRIPPALPPRSPYRQSAPAASVETSPQLPQDSFHDKATDPLSPQPSHLAEAPSHDHDLKTDSIDQTLSTIHLSPHSPSHSSEERKVSEDTASMSGSDYSRETPGIEERPQTPLTSEDQEATPVKPRAPSDGFHDISMEDEEATPVKPTAAIVTGDGFHDEYVMGEGKHGKEGMDMKREQSQASEKWQGEDEFHSVPGTPVDARGRGNVPGQFP